MRYSAWVPASAALLVALFMSTAVEAASFCTCEDRDNDGRFGVVLHQNGNQSVIRPNQGTYYDCRSLKSTLSQCNPTGGFCACEDRDRDGRFGVVQYQKSSPVLRPNQGNYYDCVSFRSSLAECGQAGNYCACEDRDNDGRFGVVLYGQSSGRVIRPNQGNYYDCTSFKATLNECRPGTSYCACEDRDNDGRFGVVLYPGVNQGRSSVIRANQGTYYQCASIKTGMPQCR